MSQPNEVITQSAECALGVMAGLPPLCRRLCQTQEDKRRVGRGWAPSASREDMMVPSLRKAIEGDRRRGRMTVYFHHPFREGDQVLNLVMAEIAAMASKNLTSPPRRSIRSKAAPDHIRNASSPASRGLPGIDRPGDLRGLMERPMVIRSHSAGCGQSSGGLAHRRGLHRRPCATPSGTATASRGPRLRPCYAQNDATTAKDGGHHDYLERPGDSISINPGVRGDVVRWTRTVPQPRSFPPLRITRDT
jgi:citrate lyase alpha subunit